MKTKQQLLREAADIIEERGLYKAGGFFSNSGQCCGLGAVGLAMGGHVRASDWGSLQLSFDELGGWNLIDDLNTDLGKACGWDDLFTEWNDMVATQDLVTSLFRSLADDLDWLEAQA